MKNIILLVILSKIFIIKWLYAIFIFLSTLNTVNGQLIYPLDTIIYTRLKYFIVIDDIKVEILQNSVDKRFIFINGNHADSTGINSENMPVWYKNTLFFNTTSKNISKKIMYIPSLGIKKYTSTFKMDNAFMQCYDYDFKNIYTVDPVSGNKKSYTSYNETMDCAVSSFFADTALACVTHCCGGIETCDYTRYYLVSPTNYKEVTRQIRESVKEEDAILTSLFFNFISTDKHFLHLGVQYMSDKYFVKRKIVSRIFNKDLQEIGKVLDINHPVLYGFNIQKNKMENYFVGSVTDAIDSTIKVIGGYDDKRVIIPYRFNPQLEMSMYKTYGNSLLTNEDLMGFGKYELGILRNLVFAKYNYAFSSEFYQAYFNLYEFYGNREARQSRVDNVSDKFTETDRANIKLVKDAENKLIDK